MVRSAMLDAASASSDAGRHGAVWAAAVAIVFAAIAFASLAVDLSLSLCAPGSNYPQHDASVR